MGHLASLFGDELKYTIQDPKRLLNLLKPHRWAYIRYKLKVRNEWTRPGDQFKSREYRSYDEYVEHQVSKLGQLDLSEYDKRYREALRGRLASSSLVTPPMNALCLGARLGTEVKSFIDLGLFAVGIDLEPGKGNKYVLCGDFHDLQYADSSVDVIFSNAIDHAFDFGKLGAEVARVLHPGGLLILELPYGTEDGKSAGFWASFWWNKTSDVIQAFEQIGFSLKHRQEFTYPWQGSHVCLALTQPVSKN